LSHSPYLQIAVIGGGASGFFFAINVADKLPQARVTIFEKGNKFLSKVKVSGGGRCNVTNATFQVKLLCEKYPRGATWLRKVFERFGPQDTVDWFKDRGVLLKTEPDHRIFPITDSSQTIIDCLMDEAKRLGVVFRTSLAVEKVAVQGAKFKVQSSEGEEEYDIVFVATGGYPKLESYQWMQHLGLNIKAPVPSLFTFNLPSKPFQGLEGIALRSTVKLEKSKLQETGPLLFTHWGLSGPVVLRLSAWGAEETFARNYTFNAFLNFVPDQKQDHVRVFLTQRKIEAKLKTVASNREFDLPSRLWERLVEQAEMDKGLKWSDVSMQKINKLTELLTNFPVQVSGKTTFKEEFVTCGGVKLEQINSATMEANTIPNLYFGGEVLDVDGITGGFNFQNAWSTAWVASEAVKQKALG
jgi:predicted Rossmann fold flavoprotein